MKILLYKWLIKLFPGCIFTVHALHPDRIAWLRIFLHSTTMAASKLNWSSAGSFFCNRNWTKRTSMSIVVGWKIRNKKLTETDPWKNEGSQNMDKINNTLKGLVVLAVALWNYRTTFFLQNIKPKESKIKRNIYNIRWPRYIHPNIVSLYEQSH